MVYLKAQLIYYIKRKTYTANVSLMVQSTSSGRKNKSDTPSDLSTTCRDEWCLKVQTSVAWNHWTWRFQAG